MRFPMKRAALTKFRLLTLVIFAAALWPRHPGVSTHAAPQLMATLGEVGRAVTELVVDFRDDEPHDRIAALGRTYGVEFRPASAFYDATEVYTVHAADPEKLLRALRADGDVEAADF